MKKIFLTVSVICLSALLMTGCTDKNEDADVNASKKKESSSSSGPSAAEMSQLPAEEYYDKYAEKVEDVISAEDYEAVYTEAEAAALFDERGFTQYPVTYDYSISGEYVGETEVSDDLDESHPIYQTYYVAENEDIWVIYLIGDALSADPLSYNLESDGGATLMLSETEEFLSYDCEENKFYRTVPKETSVELYVADEINAELLEELSREGY